MRMPFWFSRGLLGRDMHRAGSESIGERAKGRIYCGDRIPGNRFRRDPGCGSNRELRGTGGARVGRQLRSTWSDSRAARSIGVRCVIANERTRTGMSTPTEADRIDSSTTATQDSSTDAAARIAVITCTVCSPKSSTVKSTQNWPEIGEMESISSRMSRQRSRFCAGRPSACAGSAFSVVQTRQIASHLDPATSQNYFKR